MRDVNHLLMLLFLSLSMYQLSTIVSSSSTSPKPYTHHQCLDHQKSALSLLQQNLFDQHTHSKAELWDLKTDCCSWEGVACDHFGHATQLHFNGYYELQKPILETVFKNLSFLEELNLDFVDISVQGSNWCEHISHALPNLRVLSLYSSGFTGPLCSSLSNLHSLSELYLDYTYPLSSNIPPNFLVNSSNLVILTLSYCGLTGSFPPHIFLLPKLQHIDISHTNLSGELLEFPFNSSTQYLSLDKTYFSGKLPWSIGNLKSLRTLDLGDCKFSGVIPPSIANLTLLDFLDLSGNSFSGSIPPFHRDGVPNLSYLHLYHNQLDGIHDSSLLTLPSLQDLDLSFNELKGELNEIPNASSSMLESLDLSENSLNGSIPRSIFELPHLKSLDLLNNRFSRPVKLGDFQNQTNLFYLSLSGVSVVSHNTSLAFVQLEYLQLRSCNLSEFPNFLKAQNSLTGLDLSNNQIQGLVPDWMWKGTLFGLDLSFNPINFPKNPYFGMLNVTNSSFPSLSNLLMRHCDLTSSFPGFIEYQKDLYNLDLSDNYLSGQIPNWIWNHSRLSYLNLSHNKFHSFERFSGSFSEYRTSGTLDFHANRPFPEAICSYNIDPVFIDMSYNNLSGQIPDCLGNFRKLEFLDLQRNNFNGVMPSFALASGLKSLKISGNKVGGKLSRSLTNCSKLEVLDLGDNMIHDTFPFWLEKLPRLQILILRRNRFYGGIGVGVLNTMSMLHVVDLSCNEFTGDLSKEFVQGLIAMQVTSNNYSTPSYVGDDGSGYYRESISIMEVIIIRESMTIMNKGLEMHMERILTLFSCLDLSHNRLYGEIPKDIRYLKSLKVLNLSHNNLIGQIPSSMSNLTELESLDLSNNKLSGEIPPQLTSLTFLAVVNFSYNQLEGSIPQGNQFGTFSKDSYVGNPRLCGPPFTRKCGAEVDVTMSPLINREDSWIEYILDWKIVGMGYASGLVIGFSIGYTIFSQMRIKWFTNLERRAKKHGRRFRQGQLRIRNGR